MDGIEIFIEQGGRNHGFGDIHAERYDESFGDWDDVQLVAGVLHELAAGGDALEFGVGTGRFALSLARRGTRVHGVDKSEAMLRILRSKMTDEPIVPILDDFIDVRLDVPVSLVYCTFSSLFLLEDQAAQIECLRNAAAHLPIGGKLLLEMFVHDRTRFRDNQEVRALEVDESGAVFRVATLSPNDQVVTVQKIGLFADRTEMMPNRLRFIYPAELELMARLAGFRTVSRWCDWSRHPFTTTSDYLIAVFEKTV